MAVKASIGTGNWTTAGTWGIVDATSYLNSETGSEILTTAYSGTRSSTFTPGAIEISAIGVKLSVRTGTTGTMSVELVTGGVAVAGTEVTINTADLPAATTADLNGGWIILKLAAPVTLLAATAYSIEAKTSSASQISLFRDGTTDNISRVLITTTTGAPAAGDDLIVTGEYTGAGTSNTFTVTMDETAATDYGAASTSLVTPALAICSKGTLTWGTTAATNYVLKISGNLIEYAGGTHNRGTVATPCPRDSTMKLQFDIGTNVEFGRVTRNLATVVEQGLSRTVSKNIYYCFLNTDEAVNSTSLGVDTDTGWLDNDLIAVFATNRTIAESEQGALNGNAGASTLTVDGFAGAGGGLAFAHSGTSPTQAEVILLTRNVSMFGTSTTLQTYWDIKATASVDCDWSEYYWMGSATANKRGIDVACTTGTQTFHFISVHDFIVASSVGMNITGASGTGLTVGNSVFYFFGSAALQTAANSGSSVIDSCFFAKNPNGVVLVIMGDAGGTFTNHRFASGQNAPLSATGGDLIGTWSDLNMHSSANGFAPTSSVYGTITNLTSWRNTASAITAGGGSITFVNAVFFGNGLRNLLINPASMRYVFENPTFSGDTTFSTPIGISFQSSAGSAQGATVIVYGGSFGVVSGIKTAHTTADIDFGTSGGTHCPVVLINTTLASTTEVGNQTNMSPYSYVSAQRLDGTAGNHKTWMKYGTLDIASPSVVGMTNPVLRMLPTSATFKLESAPLFLGMQAAVDDTKALTVSVDIHKVAAYNGNQPRLVLRRNDALGITADVVLDTATVGTGTTETLTGTTAAVTDNGVLEFYVDCDGTAGAGYLYIDNWTVTQS